MAKISEKNAQLLRTIRAAVGGDRFTAVEIALMVAGLAVKEHVDLARALGPRLHSKKSLGHWLRRHHGAVVDGHRLCAEHIGRCWEYQYIDMASLHEDDVILLEAAEFEGRMSRSGPGIKTVEIKRRLEKLDERHAEQAARRALEKAEAERQEAMPKEQPVEPVDQEALDAGKTRLYSTQRIPIQDAQKQVETIHRPAIGVECRLHNVSDQSGGFASVIILLSGGWAQRKHCYQQLLRLFKLRGWGRIDGEITPALLRGSEIPAWASQDPAHYSTSNLTVQIANDLAAKGISSDQLSLEDAVQRSRAWHNWNYQRLGDGLTNPGPHFGAAVPLGDGTRYNPLDRTNDWAKKIL